jgi:DNA-directed RNA polymerase subunit N (RpoN/RPB10)
MHFISQDLEDYIEQHSERARTIGCVKQRNLRKHCCPRMLSGHFQGRVLSMLSN